MDAVPMIVTRYIDAYNAMDIEEMLVCLSTDIRFLNRSDGEVPNDIRGIDDFRALAEQGLQLFAARRQTIIDCIAIDDHAALRIAYHATIKADLPNGWKAGQLIEPQGRSFFTIRDGEICEIVDAN